MSRESTKKCPVCGTALKKPDPSGDWHEWDCFGCGLEVPNRFTIEGEAVIDFAATQPDPAAFLKAVNALRC